MWYALTFAFSMSFQLFEKGYFLSSCFFFKKNWLKVIKVVMILKGYKVLICSILFLFLYHLRLPLSSTFFYYSVNTYYSFLQLILFTV